MLLEEFYLLDVAQLDFFLFRRLRAVFPVFRGRFFIRLLGRFHDLDDLGHAAVKEDLEILFEFLFDDPEFLIKALFDRQVKLFDDLFKRPDRLIKIVDLAGEKIEALFGFVIFRFDLRIDAADLLKLAF